MKLIDYRKEQKLSRAKLGKIIGVDGITVWRYETGRSMPKPETIRKIKEWSGGKVTADDLVAGVA